MVFLEQIKTTQITKPTGGFKVKIKKMTYVKIVVPIIVLVAVHVNGVDKGRMLEAKHQKKIRTTIAKTSSSVINNGWAFTHSTLDTLLAYGSKVKEVIN